MNLLMMSARENIALATLCTLLIKQAVGRDCKATLSREHVGEIRSRTKRRLAGRCGRGQRITERRHSLGLLHQMILAFHLLLNTQRRIENDDRHGCLLAREPMGSENVSA